MSSTANDNPSAQYRDERPTTTKHETHKPHTILKLATVCTWLVLVLLVFCSRAKLHYPDPEGHVECLSLAESVSLFRHFPNITEDRKDIIDSRFTPMDNSSVAIEIYNANGRLKAELMADSACQAQRTNDLAKLMLLTGAGTIGIITNSVGNLRRELRATRSQSEAER